MFIILVFNQFSIDVINGGQFMSQSCCTFWIEIQMLKFLQNDSYNKTQPLSFVKLMKISPFYEAPLLLKHWLEFHNSKNYISVAILIGLDNFAVYATLWWDHQCSRVRNYLIFRAKFFLFNWSDVNEECFLCGFRENKIFI
jgi:hypothetical protein